VRVEEPQNAPAAGAHVIPPRLIALDWGTSNLRASLLGAGGACLEERAAATGIMAVVDRQFNAALLALCGDWLRAHAVPLVASGMIGSQQGWVEAPYLHCPASLPQAAAALTLVAVDTDASQPARTLHLVPGLRCTDADGVHDVMRGEETQVWGADAAAGSCCLLPGTHSKWAWLDGAGCISHFRTFMTGELYALLSKHGILGRLMVFGHESEPDFSAGVRRGLSHSAQATHALFAARTAGLMGQVAPEGLPDYLSGMLIGIEVAGALQSMPATSAPLTLIGDDALCRRYTLALQLAGQASELAAAGAATRGQWRVAVAAGLVTDSA